MFGPSFAVPPYGHVILSRMFHSSHGRRCVSMVTKLLFKECANYAILEPVGAKCTRRSRFSCRVRRLTWTRRGSPRPREESELFPGFKQAQIVANLCVLGAPSAREEEWILQSNKNTGGSINPAPLIRSDFFPPRCFQMLGPGDVNYLTMHLLSPFFVSLSTSGFWCGRGKKYPLKAKSSQFPHCSCY